MKSSDSKKTTWESLFQTSSQFRDAAPHLGVSQKSKINSSRVDAGKATIQDDKRYQCHQNKRTSYENQGTVAKPWSNTGRFENATVGKEDETKLWSNSGRFKNSTVGKEDETKLWSNAGRFENSTVGKEDETKPWSNTGRFENSTVDKEDETKLWSNTGRFTNTTVGKEDETKLWSNSGRFTNATVGKEDETKLWSNSGRFKNSTVGKEDETKLWSNAGRFENSTVGKEDETKPWSNTGRFENSTVDKEDETKLWSNTGRFTNTTVGKEDETKLWSNSGRFTNATVGKEDETKLWSNSGRFKNSTVGKEDETKLWSNAGRFENSTVGKEDETKPWSNTGRFENSTVDKEDETKLWSNTGRFTNTTVGKEDETKLWSNSGRFTNATVGKEDETKLWSNTGRFTNATVGKEDETKLWSNTGRFTNATVGKEDETKLWSNAGRFTNATVGKEDETKLWSNTGRFTNATVGKEDETKLWSNSGRFTNAAVGKEDETKLWSNTGRFTNSTVGKEDETKLWSNSGQFKNSTVGKEDETKLWSNTGHIWNVEHLDIEKNLDAASPLFNTTDQPSTSDTFVKDGGSLNENEATSLAHVKGDTSLFVSNLPTDSSNDELMKNKENVKRHKNHESNSGDIFSDECEQNTNISSKQDNVQPPTLNFNFTLGTSLDSVDKCPRDNVAVRIHDEPFSQHLSLDGHNEANAKISEIKAVHEGSYNNGVVTEKTIQENASEEISVSDETESVCDSVSESSKMSDFSEGREHSKNPFLVILRNLPVSLKRQEIIALFKGIYPGFVKASRTRKKGKAIAVFSSKEYASNCAKQMKGKIIHGSKIVAFATSSKSNSNLDKDLLKKEVPGTNEKVSNWLESKHMESEELCTEDVQDQQQEQKHRHQEQQKQQLQKAPHQKHKQQPQKAQPQKQQQQETQAQKRQQQKKHLKQQQHEPQQQQEQQSQKQSQQKPKRQKQKQQQQSQKTQKQQPQEAQQQEIQPLTRRQRKQLRYEKQQSRENHEPQQQKQQEQKPQHQQQKTPQQQQKTPQQQQKTPQQQQQEQQSQEQLQMQQKHQHPQEQLSSQQQQRENDIGKENLVLLLQQQLALKQQQKQQQRSKIPQNHAVQLRGFPKVIEFPEIQKFIYERCEGVEIINVVKDVEDLEKYFVKLKSQNDGKKVKEALQGSSFKGKEIKSTWTKRKNTNLDKPYVVVENLLPQFTCQDVKNFFANCKGVVNVDVLEGAKKSHARVYFESVDLAGEAVEEMNGFRVGMKELTVTPGVGISEELEWRKLECQVQEYLELLQKNREFLIRKNDEKLKDLENNTPDPRPRRKKVSLEEFVRREETKETYERKKQELVEQRSEFEKKFQQLFENFNQQVEEQRSVNNKKGIEYILQNHESKTDREFRKFEASLPIYAKRTEILETIQHSQVVVLIGETGSGKSTQVAQYLAEETLNYGGKIVVTQPRKIAAISLAKRVSEEFGCNVGQEVGYHVGLDKEISNKTIIKFVTDRILLNEVLKGDEIMQQYSCIVIDEAHERSIHTDLLVAMLKQKLTSFPHLKLIVTSATLNTEIFRTYFDNCPLVKVPGRTFPVERVYSRERPEDYVEGVYDKVVEVCESGEPGDILVFLTQQNEIEKACDKLEKKLGKEAVILPLHGKLQSDEQQKVLHDSLINNIL